MMIMLLVLGKMIQDGGGNDEALSGLSDLKDVCHRFQCRSKMRPINTPGKPLFLQGIKKPVMSYLLRPISSVR